MRGINYFKSEPTEYARISVNGKTKNQGKGIAGFYLPFRTTIELISLTSKDQPFGFTEVSNDKQEICLQGGIVYKITNMELILGKYNFSIDPQSKLYLNEEGVKLPENIIQVVQAEAKQIVQAKPLEDLLVMTRQLAEEVTEKLVNYGEKIGIGVELLYFSSIKPKPEIAKALEAQYREALLQKADEAIYSRRAIAVEKERAIKENELRTSIGLEQKRKELVDLEGANILKAAEFRIQAAERELSIYENVEPAKVAALALYELGKNADKIENLSITPEILSAILTGVKNKK